MNSNEVESKYLQLNTGTRECGEKLSHLLVSVCLIRTIQQRENR